jgi:hypothetical protein
MIFFASRMTDQGRRGMYGGWKKSGAHTTEWMNKTQEFIDCAFFVPPDQGVKCTYNKCRNALSEDKSVKFPPLKRTVSRNQDHYRVSLLK